MSLYIPKMSDTPGVTIPGLAGNFGALDTHISQPVTQAGGVHGLQVESGNWTPTLLENFAELSVQIGRYTRVGNRVFLSCCIVLASAGGGISATFIGGVPFPAKFTAEIPSFLNLDGSLRISGGGFSIGENVVSLLGQFHLPDSINVIEQTRSGVADIDGSRFGAGTEIRLSINYEI